MARTKSSSPTRSAVGTTTNKGRAMKAAENQMRVRCPNPDCEVVYTVSTALAGKRARCGACGERTLIPSPRSVSVSTPPPPQPAKTAKQAPDPPTTRTITIPEVRTGCIGRGHAGKTALFHALSDSLIGDYLPSGLHLDAADPREVARMIREAEDSQRLLHQSGLPPTLEVSQNRYCVFEGDRPRVVCRMREVIGQVLTHTLPGSEPQLQEQYTDYLQNLVNAHVLWVVVPCPPANSNPRDRRRYANDLRITLAYLRESLRLRNLKQPAAIAIVLSKTDAMFPTLKEARESLTDAVLARALGPLVHLIQQSIHVSDAAVIPVTAFGFGKAVLREDATERHEAPGSADEPFGDEPIWLLKEGESPTPYNLDTLFLWSVLLGLMNQVQPGAALPPAIDRLCRMLRDDLEAADPWIVPLKGGVKLAVE
jgi:hypothetical protein